MTFSSFKHTRKVFASSSAREPSTFGEAVVYNSVAGPSRKVTLEYVYGPLMHNEQAEAEDDSGPSTSASQQGPWKMSWQMSERNMTWSNDLKNRLIKVNLVET
jgi:hypothetical protein